MGRQDKPRHEPRANRGQHKVCGFERAELVLERIRIAVPRDLKCSLVPDASALDLLFGLAGNLV